MSRFYGSMQGARGEATRRGTTASGLDAHIRGWTTGVRVVARPLTTGERSAHPDVDAFDVYATTGSSPDSPDVLVGTVYRMPGEPVRFEPADIVQDPCGGIVAAV